MYILIENKANYSKFKPGFEIKSKLFTKLLAVVDLPIVNQMNMGQVVNSYGLLPIQIIDDGQAMECQTAMVDVRYCL